MPFIRFAISNRKNCPPTPDIYYSRRVVFVKNPPTPSIWYSFPGIYYSFPGIYYSKRGGICKKNPPGFGGTASFQPKVTFFLPVFEDQDWILRCQQGLGAKKGMKEGEGL